MNKTNELPERSERYYGKRFNGVFPVTGTVHVIRNESELSYVREGEIIVAEYVDPAWKDQLSLAKAIIEGKNAADSKAEALAAQYDIPAVAGVQDALTLRSGDIVTISGEGEIELRPELRAPDSPMRVSVPVAVEARDQDGVIIAPNVVSLSAHRKAIQENEEADDDSMDDLHEQN